MPLQSILSSRSNTRLKVERYIDHTVNQISTRTIGKDPLSAITIWNGDVTLPTVQRNPLLWGYDLRDQLAGYVGYKSAWGESAGGLAITRRHLLQCAHWGDSFEGVTARFTSGDSSTYFQTTIIKQSPLSPPLFATFEGHSYDLQVFLLQDELPPWVNLFSIIQFTTNELINIPTGSNKTSGKVLPTISVSQGPQKLYMGNNWSYDVLDTISNDGSNYGKKSPYPNIHPYYYNVFVGDSGTPAFTLINNVLYAIGVVTTSPYGVFCTYSPSHISFINELIRRVDVDAGISTGYTVLTTDFSSLKF